MKKQNFAQLSTPFAQGGAEYPRPTLKRDSFFSLDGEWRVISESYEGDIRVPFVPQSHLSGIGRDIGEEFRYEKVFSLPDGFVKNRTFIHFGAVDAVAEVSLNGIRLGSHEGGYLPFSFELTDVLADGENLLEVRVTDRLDSDLPYGKQRRDRGGMWYTPISGIWQSVWLESTPKSFIEGLRITPSADAVKISVKGGDARKTLVLEDGREVSFEGNEITLKIDAPELWTPENPRLYSFNIICGEDEVSSYFALRTVETAGNRVLLNGKPYFFHGLLDQGYFPDGIYTPPSSKGYEFDILGAKKLGFNMLRKHAKIEPELFYYYCDKHGIAVFQDFVNSGKYSFLVDTALPNIGLLRGISHRASHRRRERFEKDGEDTLNFLYNHPSVCAYTVFNEGWGQYDADRLYTKMKSLDPTRLFDTTSGWFFETKSDFDSRHIYFKKIKLKSSEKPTLLSEFGGYSCKIEGHSYNLCKNYGYKFFKSVGELEQSLARLYFDEVLPAVKNGLSGAVLTQLSDVEDETNGLYTYDRRVLKVSEEIMKNIRRALDGAMAEAEGGKE